MLAKTYYDSAKYEQAINYYKRKGEIKSITNADEYWLGMSYFKTDQNLEADSSFAKVLAATPNFASAWIMRARIANGIDTIGNDTVFLAKPFYEQYITLAEADSTKNYKAGRIEAYQYMGVYWACQGMAYYDRRLKRLF